MTDKTKGGEDYEVTEEHPDVRYEDEYPEEEDYEAVERYPEEEGRVRTKRSKRKGGRMKQGGSRQEGVEKSTAEIWAGGSTFEAVCGAAAVALTILGLVGVAAVELLSIATIAVGAGMMFAGASVAAKFRRAMEETAESRSEKAALTGGISTEVIGGIGGVVLGILALLGIQPMVLIPAAAIAMGGAAFFGAGATEEMKDISFEQAGASRQSRRRASQGIAGAAGFQVFIGLAAAALGILALAGMAPMTLSLVALLSLGTSELISGAAVGGHMMQRIAA